MLLKNIRLSLIICISLITNLTFSQLTKSNKLFRLTGSYVETNNSSGGSIFTKNELDKTLHVGASLAYCLSNHFAAGIGLEYLHSKTLNNTSINYYSNWYMAEMAESKANVISPSVFLNYYRNFSEKWVFTLCLNSGYGNAHIKTNSMSVGEKALNVDTLGIYSPEDFFLRSEELIVDYNYFNISLQPELSYFITEKIGICLEIGNISYTYFDFKFHLWDIRINPAHWTYGVFFRFGKQKA